MQDSIYFMHICIFLNNQELVGMEKKEFRENIRKNLQRILKQRRMSQVQLQKECEKHGYQISQPELSKALAGKTPVTLYQLSAFAKVFDLSMDQLINGEKVKQSVMLDGGPMFVTDPSDKAYNGYLGTFHVLLHSTSTPDDKWHVGILKLEASDDPEMFCKAFFDLNTDVKDSRGRDIIKHYTGQFIISVGLGAAYCVLVNKEIGELAFMEFRYRNFFIKQMECRLGFLLSTASGEQKLPVVQKIMLSRSAFSDEKLRFFKPYLKMMDDETIVLKSDLQFLREKYADFRIDFSAVDESEPCYVLNEKGIRGKNRSVSRTEIAAVVSSIRALSLAPYLLHISEREDSLLYDIENKFAE